MGGVEQLSTAATQTELTMDALAQLEKNQAELEADMNWWWNDSRWFRRDCDRLNATLRTGEWDVRISSQLTASEAWTNLEGPTSLAPCGGVRPLAPCAGGLWS